MPIRRGSEDTHRDHPDAPKRLRRNSKLVVNDQEIVALRKHAAALKAKREAAEEAARAPIQEGFDL